jgi:SPP1 gp7 family putative phage head morphogenesis protein
MAELLDAVIRHQIYIEGLKRNQNAGLALKLAQMNTELKAEFGRLEFKSLGDMTKRALMQFLARLKKLADGVFNAWLNETIEWLQRYISIDREMLPRIFAAVSNKDESDFEDAKDDAGIWALATNNPMAANGIAMLAFMKGYAFLGSSRIVQVVNMSYANKLSPDEAVKSIIGSKERRYNDGLIATLNRQGASVTNTVIQHTAAQTSSSVARAAWLQYLWISVLDNATTDICRSRNGHVWRYGEGPLPPAHVGCRSSTMPFDGTGPITMPTFTMWANGQPREFVNDAFDGEPGSKYEGSKAVNLDGFARKFELITA